jgi:peroxiredoxin 2/4
LPDLYEIRILTINSIIMIKKNLFFSLLIIAAIQLNAQNSSRGPALMIGDDAPSFTARSTNGVINFPRDYGKEWKILFAHPKDFTPVCSSEILELAQQQAEYKKLGVQVVVMSTDLLSQHYSWIKALDEINYKDREPVKIEFPLVADSNYTISYKYGMIHPTASNVQSIRAVYIIDPDNKIRSINFYPMQVGRNMDEIMRTLIALQTVDSNTNTVTPANWNPGDKLLVPALSQTEIDNINSTDSKIDQVAWFMNFRQAN